MPINFIVIYVLPADCKEALYLIKNINTKLVFAYRAYNTNEILSYPNEENIKPVILQKHNRLDQRYYKSFRILKTRDNPLNEKFIVSGISLKILFKL